MLRFYTINTTKFVTCCVSFLQGVLVDTNVDCELVAEDFLVEKLPAVVKDDGSKLLVTEKNWEAAMKDIQKEGITEDQTVCYYLCVAISLGNLQNSNLCFSLLLKRMSVNSQVYVNELACLFVYFP